MIDPVTRGLLPALVTVVMALAPSGLDGCKKLGGASSTASVEPPPPLLPTATTPPIWAPPETAAPPPVTGALPASPGSGADLVKARQLAQAGDNKKVRALLEKKVRAGKASRDEASVLLDACVALRDKPCVDATRGKYPDAAPN